MCPFIGNKNVCCDFGGMEHSNEAMQCPTQIFNKCQSSEDGMVLDEQDKLLIEKLV